MLLQLTVTHVWRLSATSCTVITWRTECCYRDELVINVPSSSDTAQQRDIGILFNDTAITAVKSFYFLL